jgi:hypothetical protein
VPLDDSARCFRSTRARNSPDELRSKAAVTGAYLITGASHAIAVSAKNATASQAKSRT